MSFKENHIHRSRECKPMVTRRTWRYALSPYKSSPYESAKPCSFVIATPFMLDQPPSQFPENSDAISCLPPRNSSPSTPHERALCVPSFIARLLGSSRRGRLTPHSTCWRIYLPHLLDWVGVTLAQNSVDRKVRHVLGLWHERKRRERPLGSNEPGRVSTGAVYFAQRECWCRGGRFFGRREA